MVSIRSKLLRGSTLLSFIFLFPACSEKATCALEGCTSNGSVKMVGDQQASQDARPDDLAAAKAEIEKAKKALEDAFAELKDRVIFNESVDKLQNDMLHLHDVRIAALELRVSAIDTKILSLESEIAASNEAIAANEAALVRAREELAQAAKDGDAALKAQLEAHIAGLVSEQKAVNLNVTNRVIALEGFRAAQEITNGALGTDIGALQNQVAGLLTTIGSVSDSSQSSSIFGLIKKAQEGVAAATSLATNIQNSIPGLLSTLETTLRGELNSAKSAVLQDIANKLVEAKSYIDGEISGLGSSISDIEIALKNKSECTYGVVKTIINVPLFKLVIKAQDVTCDGNTFSVIVP